MGIENYQSFGLPEGCWSGRSRTLEKAMKAGFAAKRICNIIPQIWNARRQAVEQACPQAGL